MTVPPVESSDPASGLVVLAGRVGAMALGRLGPDGRAATIPSPDRNAAWVSASSGGGLLVTTLDGRAFLGTRPVPGGPTAWRALRIIDPETGSPATGLAFGTLSADGSVAAFVTGLDPSPDGGRVRSPDRPAGPWVLRVPVAGEAAAWLPLGGEPTGSAPTWLGRDLLVPRRAVGDRVVVAVAGEAGLAPWVGPSGPGSGPPLPDRIVAVSGSANGSVVAILHGDLDTVTLVERPASGEPPPSGGPSAAATSTTFRLEPLADGSEIAESIALSPAGDRLAIVRADAFGNAVTVEVRTVDGGWTRAGGWDLPAGADRAVVAWAP